jgi:hypothetical protein
VRGPLREVSADTDGATTWAWRVADRDVLPEGRGALDGWLVDLLMLPDGVGGSISSVASDLLALGSTLAVAVLLDVVLNERVGGPAVDGNENGS